jgi:universal stress protein A
MSRTFTTILVPVDFSAYAREALLYADSIAERFFSTLLILHVISKEVELHTTRQHVAQRGLPMLGPLSDSLEVPTEVMETVTIDLRERAHTALQEFLPPQFSGRSVELLVAIGHPFEQILETTANRRVELIVMGTHGRTGLAHTMLGSVAERVMRLAPCPVLTVKAPKEAS